MQLDMYNSSLKLHPSDQCTKEVLSGQISLFSLLTGDPSSVILDDLTVVVNNFATSSVPVFNQSSNTPSEPALSIPRLWLVHLF